MVQRILQVAKSILLHVANHSVAICFSVLPTGYMNPVIFVVGGLENHLVEVGIVLDEVNPTVSGLHVGVTTVVIPGGISREGQQEVGGFA